MRLTRLSTRFISLSSVLVAAVLVVAGTAPQALVAQVLAQRASGPLTWESGDEAVLAATLSDRFGIDHISYGNGRFSNDRYRLALDAGAGWNRWAFYWHDIERQPGGFDFSTQDATVRADRAQGLKILGILFGTPQWALEPPPPPPSPSPSPSVSSSPSPSASPAPSRSPSPSPSPVRARDVAALDDGALLPRIGQKGWPDAVEARLQEEPSPPIVNSVQPPRGLWLPVFADGTDSPSAGKAINPDNVWARFVQRTALQYRGLVSAWEIWNEPDFAPAAATGWFGFWSGGVDNYARLLKVAYLTIKSVDASTPVVMAGMSHWHDPEFFPNLLQVIARDPIARQYSYYFDATAWHWYSRASQLWERTLWIKDELAQFGMQGKQIWVTETNLPVCNDTGSTPVIPCTPGSHKASLDNSAAYVFQAIAYGLAAGVDKFFFFQLMDDEQPPGEGYGLVRNNGTPRPNYTALKLATGYFSKAAAAYRTLSNAGRIELITMSGGPGQRLRLAWNTQGASLTAMLPVDGTGVSVVEQGGSVQSATADTGGLFQIGLPGATANDSSRGDPDYLVGGKPYLLVENGVNQSAGAIEGVVKDLSGKAQAGLRVQVGDRTAATDGSGRYRVELPPGLYDVSVATIVPLSDPTLSAPVWAGRTTARDYQLRPLYRQFLPVSPFRAQPVR